jgi:hypothetical protein
LPDYVAVNVVDGWIEFRDVSGVKSCFAKEAAFEAAAAACSLTVREGPQSKSMFTDPRKAALAVS